MRMIIRAWRSKETTQNEVKDKASCVRFALVHLQKQDLSPTTGSSPTGECATVRHNNSLYEPPPAADIEQMKRNKILEQKAFALLREILSK